MAVREVSNRDRSVVNERTEDLKKPAEKREASKAALAPAAPHAAAPSKVALKLIADGSLSRATKGLKEARVAPLFAPLNVSQFNPKMQLATKTAETLRKAIAKDELYPLRKLPAAAEMTDADVKFVLARAISSYDVRQHNGRVSITIDAWRNDVKDEHIIEAVRRSGGRGIDLVVRRPWMVEEVASKAMADLFDQKIRMKTSADGEPLIDLTNMPRTEYSWREEKPTVFHTKRGDMTMEQVREVLNKAQRDAGFAPASVTYTPRDGGLE